MLFCSTPGSLSVVPGTGCSGNLAEPPEIPMQAPSHILVLLCSSITKEPGGKITTSYSVTANLLTSCAVPEADSSTSKALQEVSLQVVCLFFCTQDLVVIAAMAGSITALKTLLTNWLQEERWGCVRAAAELGRSQLLTSEPHCMPVLFPPRDALLSSLLPVCQYW